MEQLERIFQQWHSLALCLAGHDYRVENVVEVPQQCHFDSLVSEAFVFHHVACNVAYLARTGCVGWFLSVA